MKNTVHRTNGASFFAILEHTVYLLLFVIFVICLDVSNIFSAFISSGVGETIELWSARPEGIIFICIVVGALLLIAATLLVRDLGRTMRDHNINSKDIFIIKLTVASGILLVWSMVSGGYCYKYFLCSTAIIASAAYITSRVVLGYSSKQKTNNSEVVTLADLYYGRIPDSSKYLLLEDSEVDEDIFNRESTINKICKVIRSNINGKNITISLVGPWGSGKSTLLECVRKNVLSDEKCASDTIIINDFEPWVYNDNETMVREFANNLFRHIGYKINRTTLNEFVKDFLSISTTGRASFFYGHLPIKNTKDNPVELVNNYLVGNNKKLVIIIDNLERSNKDIIVNLLKTIKNKLLFKNTIYIFSYDDNMLDELLCGSQIDRKYLEKFSQITIGVPEIKDDIKRTIVSKCIENYLAHAGEGVGDRNELVTVLSNSIRTPRQLLLDINSAFAGENNNVNITDALLINILRREAPNLYEIIKNNKWMFVYRESLTYPGLSNGYSDEVEKYTKTEIEFFNKQAKNETVLKEIISHRDMLGYLFPNIARFLDGAVDSSFVNLTNTPAAIEKARKERRIRVDDFFSLYFTYGENRYTRAADEVDGLLGSSPEKIRHELFNYFENHDQESQRYIFHRLEERVKELSNETIDYLAYGVAEQSVLFSRSRTQLGLSARDASHSFLATLIPMTSEAVFRKIISYYAGSISNLEALHSLEYWLRPSSQRYNHSLERYNNIVEVLNKMKENIVNERKNLFDIKYYRYGSVRLLGEKSEIIAYLKTIKERIARKNQILLLADFIYKSSSSDGSFGYEIDYAILNEIFSVEGISDAVRSAKKSELKEVVAEIVKGAKDDKRSFTPGAKTYTCKTNYDLFGLTDSYTKLR